MQVIATAGHVDHGKSTLLRALTGMEPDRWAEERRRGMTIDLGYVWMRLDGGEQLAFVDVPGHERFATNMLAGVGPVPAVLLVVAADEGWRPQTEEHVRALDALGVEHGVLAITRADLADPAPATRDALRRLATTSLRGLDAVAVSAVTGDGVDALRTALGELAARLPRPDPRSRVRLWVDRCFTVRGSGTVVTGTLAAGTLRRDQVLDLDGRAVSVRALQALGEPVAQISGPARAAVNLRSVERAAVRRGDVLITPDAWHRSDVVDVRVAGDLPAELVVHIGAAAMPAAVRTLGGDAVRLRLHRALPLQVGDRLLLRDPGRRSVLGAATVLDPAPPALHRRGAARARAATLATVTGRPDAADELHRRGAATPAFLRALGLRVDTVPDGAVEAAGWLVDAAQWRRWCERLRHAVAARPATSLLDSGVTHGELARSLALPEPRLLAPLVAACPDLEDTGGHVRRRGAGTALRADAEAAVERLRRRLRANPFAAPEQAELASLGLGRRELGAAAAAGAILRLPGDVVLLADAPERAAAVLQALPQPFTLSAARQAMATTRRVAVPLLEHLDRLGVTERVDGVWRRMRDGAVEVRGYACAAASSEPSPAVVRSISAS